MKKIININLSGLVIPIEDTAYENLQAYIESLRKYFANEEGRDEIINDIESRISELMSEKVRKGAKAITDADVHEIASSMGRPEDFESDTVEEKVPPRQQEGPASQETKTKKSRRLYRDTGDKFLGGVCSGFAGYINVDPAIVRILFAIITFGGFGLGVLLYIILWIILPPKDLEGYSGKRLFRNPENKVIGGVSGGLAAYFGKEAWVIRLIFAAPLILNILFSSTGWWFFHDGGFFPNIVFGSLSGTFILAYIVLWIVLPEARSPYEKMEMRGERVDVNTIRQNVQEGMGSMKDRVKQWGGEVKESAQHLGEKAKEFTQSTAKPFANEVVQTVKTSSPGIGHAFGVLFKVFFLFIAGTIAFGLFVGLMALIFGGVAWWPINNFLWTSNWQQALAWGTVILFLAVPLVGFLTWLIRRIIGIKSRNNYLGWTFGGLWALGWVVVILLASSITRDIRYYEKVTNEIKVTSQPPEQRLIVAVSEEELNLADHYWWLDEDAEGFDITEDTLKMSLIKFRILPSLDSLYHISLKKHSAGRNYEEAIDRAEKIQFRATYQNGVLDLGSGFAIDRSSKYRGQFVEMEIRVPVGKKIRFDESVRNKLNPMNVKVKRTRGWRRGIEIDVDDYYSFRWKSNTDYVMGVDGELKNSDGSPVIDYQYRYNDSNDSMDLEKSIEEKKEELRKLEEKKREQQMDKGTARKESMDDCREDEIYSNSSSPVMTLVRYLY